MKQDLSLGTWISTGSSSITELAGACGLDWVLLDLEHGATTQGDIFHQMQSLAQSKTKGIVRVGALHPEQVGQLLDWGAHGIMLPHVGSAEKASSFVRAAYHPPHGNRGIAKTVRATRFGLGSHSQNPPPVLIAQIESPEAVFNAESIAAVPGIDVLFIGPADLQHSLLNAQTSPTEPPRPFGANIGIPSEREPLGQMDAPTLSYEACLERVSAAARTHGKSAGILLRDHTEIPLYAGLGFTFLAVDSDFGILRSGYQRILSSKKT